MNYLKFNHFLKSQGVKLNHYLVAILSKIYSLLHQLHYDTWTWLSIYILDNLLGYNPNYIENRVKLKESTLEINQLMKTTSWGKIVLFELLKSSKNFGFYCILYVYMTMRHPNQACLMNTYQICINTKVQLKLAINSLK